MSFLKRLWSGFWGTRVGGYTLNLLLAFDQLGNAVLAGDHDETISSRIGRKKIEAIESGTKLGVGWRGLDWVLEKLDPGHSIDAIEWDEVREWLALHPDAKVRFDRSGRVVTVTGDTRG